MSIPIKTKVSWPVSLSEAKRHLRVEDDFHEDDDYIQNLIYAATAKAEQYIGKDIAETTNSQSLYDYSGDDLTLMEGNFNSFTEAVTDTSTAYNAIETRIYYNSAYVELSESVSSDPLVVSYKTGYDQGECLPLIKQAILIKIKDFYDEQRSSYDKGTVRPNKAFEYQLDSFRLVIW